MDRARVHLETGAFGLALGFILSSAGFSDWGEIHRMFTLGAMDPGGPSLAGARLMLAYGGALILAFVGFRLLAWRDALPPKPIRAGTVPGAIVFGAGWAVSGACPAVALVQIGEGKSAAVVTLCGMIAGAWLHDRLRKRFGWARHSCID